MFPINPSSPKCLPRPQPPQLIGTSCAPQMLLLCPPDVRPASGWGPRKEVRTQALGGLSFPIWNH